MSRAVSATRYTIIGLHIILSILEFLLSLLLTYTGILVIVHAAALLALIIYVPAAIILSLKGSRARFTRAGAEIAYLVIQLIAWLISAAFALTLCVVLDVVNYEGQAKEALLGIAIMSFIQAILMVVWLVVLVRAVRGASRVTGRSMGDVRAIAAGKLLKGDYGFESVPRDMTGMSQVRNDVEQRPEARGEEVTPVHQG